MVIQHIKDEDGIRHTHQPTTLLDPLPPFFGDIKRARVLTVGVNPSAKEFLLKRDWPEAMAASELKDRLQQYFQLGSPPPHEWFQTWNRALVSLEVTYQDGAAHIDLSPRATTSMGNAVRNGNSKLFAGMVEQDAKWFFKLLSECSKARLLLFAGCIPGSYISEFMERFAPNHGFESLRVSFPGACTVSGFGILGSFRRRDSGESALRPTFRQIPRSLLRREIIGSRTQTGPGMTGFYNIHGSCIDCSAFFCSLSPSARELKQRQMLIQRVEEHKEELRELLGPRPIKVANNQNQ